MKVADHWALLGIEPTDDRREVKRAYGRRLKEIDVDADPAAFIRLREAMEGALAWGTQQPWWETGEIVSAEEGEAIVGDLYADDAEWREADHDWQELRPTAPEAGGLALGELETLLYAEGEVEPERVAELGRALLAHPDLEHVDRAVALESWMAQAIATNFPRSDPLIPLAVERFGWSSPGAGWRRDWYLDRIIQRQEDLGFLAAAGTPGHPHHAALEELRGPPRRKLELTRLKLASDVSALLKVLPHRPTLYSDLDPESLEWWQSYLSGPHLPPHFWLWMLCLPPMLTFGILLGFAMYQVSAPPALAVLAAATGLVFLLILGWSRLAATMRGARDRALEGEMRQGLEPFAAAALALPLLAALLPPEPPFIVAASLLALVAGYGVVTRGWVEPEWSEGSARPRIFLPALAAVASLLALLQLALPPALALLLPLSILCLAGSRGYHPIGARLAPLRTSRRFALACAPLFVVVVAAILVTSAPTSAFQLALVPVAIVAAHLATAASPVDIHRFEWPLRIVVGLTYFATHSHWPDGFAAFAFLAVAIYGLGYSAVRLIAVLADEAGAPDYEAEA